MKVSQVQLDALKVTIKSLKMQIEKIDENLAETLNIKEDLESAFICFEDIEANLEKVDLVTAYFNSAQNKQDDEEDIFTDAYKDEAN